MNATSQISQEGLPGERVQEQAVARVLVVEDDSAIAEELCDALQALGYAVLGPVSTGEKALELVGKSDTDCVLMDMRLAGALDGVETAARMRVLVFLTGHSDEDTVARARAVAFGYLVKPARAAALHAAIQVALTRSALEQRIAVTSRLAAIGMTTETVAHQIANPLAAAMASLQLASEGLGRLQARIDPAIAEQLHEVATIVAEAATAANRIRAAVQNLRRLVVDDDATGTDDVAAMVDEGVGIARGLSRHLERVERRFSATPRVSAPPGQLRRIFTNIALTVAEIAGAEDSPGNGPASVWIETSTDEQGRAVVVFGTKVPRRDTSADEGLVLVGEVVASLRGELVVETKNGHLVRVALPAART